jgi:hypothetical protein
MGIYMFAFCLLPLIAIIGTIIILAREGRGRDRRGSGSR